MIDKYPQLKDLKPGEIFVESARIFKDKSYFSVYIGKVIDKDGQGEMIKALKSQLKADKAYLTTITK